MALNTGTEGKTLKYLTVFRPYKVAELVIKAKSKADGGSFGEAEAKKWNEALDKYAKKGYRVINSGTIVSGEDAIFWAMLEKT